MGEPKVKPRKAALAALVCQRYNVHLDVLKGRSRDPHVVRARTEAMFLMHHVGWSYADIGRFMDNRHPSPIYTAVNAYRANYDTPSILKSYGL